MSRSLIAKSPVAALPIPLELFVGRTVIVVSHRVSALRNADQIVVLSEGKIAELGSHSELVTQGGWYARLARAQALEEELQSIEGDAEVA